MDLIKAFSNRRAGSDTSATKQQDTTFDQYEAGSPSDQLAVDMLSGWNCCFPPSAKVKAGKLALHDDARIHWAAERFGSMEGKIVLEAGPLEGMHTYMLNRLLPKRIDAIEANRLSFMRCLVAKQIMGLNRARFRLGDVSKWLADFKGRYDLIVASGVLYHMPEPAEFIRLAASRSDALFLWTHFYLDEAMPASDSRRLPFSGKMVERTVAGVTTRCYERSYKDSARRSAFCGGTADRHYWMHRDDILALLAAVGYDDIEIFREDLKHPGGPCFSVMARRTQATAMAVVAKDARAARKDRMASTAPADAAPRRRVRPPQSKPPQSSGAD